MVEVFDARGVSFVAVTQQFNTTTVSPSQFRQAVSARPGPVFLELSIDVLFARVEEEKAAFPENYRPKSPAGPSRKALPLALQWLSEAERPAILAGGGVWFAQAITELREFKERAKASKMIL